MGRFEGKVVVITGAGGGIGRCHALAFAAEGARVLVNDRGTAVDGSGDPVSSAQTVVDEIEAAGGEARADTHSVAEMAGARALVRAATDTWGRLDILINNAGILRDKSLVNMTEEMFDAVIAVHLKGTFACGQAAFTWMKENGGGRIINTSSYAGLKGNFGQTNYAAAKAGIYGMTTTWALEGRRYGITCNALAPMAKTRMTEDIDLIPESMQAADITPMALFLASEAAADVNGRVFGIHGRQIFEYRMEMTPGVTKSDGPWTPEDIAANLDEISRSPADASPGSGDTVAAALENLLDRYDPVAAGEGETTLKIAVAGTGIWSLRFDPSGARLEPGTPRPPTCTLQSDADTLLGILDGSRDATQAFMQGQIRADHMPDLIRFGAAFGLGAGDGTDPPGLNRDRLGHAYPARETIIDPEAVEAYAAAVDDRNPRYRDPDASGNTATPPLFLVRPLMATFSEAMADPELRVDMAHLVHGEQSFTYLAPVRSGDRIVSIGRVTDIQDKSSGQTLTLSFTFDRGETRVAEATTLLFIRKPTPRPGGSSAHRDPEPDRRAPRFTATQTVAADQSRRYAEASGDHNPIHLDPEMARSVGLGDIILHGLCTMAFAVRDVVDHVLEGDPDRLTGIQVRFARPVHMGETLTTRGWLASEPGGDPDSACLAFETTNADGQPVLTRGRAMFRPSPAGE